MTVSIAWPICNRPAGDYNAVAADVCLGRPFRQPVALADAASCANGLELWLRAGSDAVKLFACVGGTVSFHPAAAGQPASIRLWPTGPVTAGLRRANTLEPSPTSFVYVNVDEETFRQALTDRITTAYATTPSHPIVRNFFWLLDEHDAKLSKGRSLKTALDKTAQANRAALVAKVVAHVLANSATDATARPPVLAGDGLGEAATAFGGVVPPGTCTFGTSVPPPRHFLFRVEEKCDRARNPLYDVWTWLNAPTVAQFTAPPNAGTANAHPILRVTAITGGLPKPAPRAATDAPLRPIPIGSLGSLHHEVFTPTKKCPNAGDNARGEWRLAADGALAPQLRSGQPGPAVTLAPATQAALVSTMWTTYGTDIASASEAFQVPAELLMAFLGRETSNLAARAVRFEGVDEAARLRADAGLLTDTDYTAAASAYAAVIPNPAGYDKPVPAQWSPSSVIRTVGNEQLTWEQVADLLDKSSYFRGRVSIGLMQTLVSVAQQTARSINLWFPDIQATYPRGNQAAANWWTYLGVAQAPAAGSGYLNDWLLNPRQSIHVGAAYIRWLYNGKVICSCWDPPKAAAAYNGGSIRDIFCNCKKKSALSTAEADAARTWGMCYWSDYMTIFGSVYNAAVAYFNTAGNPIPPVRLRP